jgi:hypothetical protein
MVAVFILGVPVGGVLADVAGDFLLLLGGGITTGIFVASCQGLLAERRAGRRARADVWGVARPVDLQRYALLGGAVGGAIGLALAILDACVLG